MHPDEVDVDEQLVRGLIADQFPCWAGLTVDPVKERGTDHALFRVGEDLLARLPIVGWAVPQAASEARWLPWLAPQVPLQLVTPLALGHPGRGYPHTWSVVGWIEGTSMSEVADSVEGRAVAAALADFVVALHRVPAAAAPRHAGGSRGVPLQRLDDGVRTALRELPDLVDRTAVELLWNRALRATPWTGEPVWIHGDLQPGNLVMRDGELVAAIDFTPGAGDPAPDLAAAWWTFEGEARRLFVRILTEAGATAYDWARAAGWVVAPALAGVGYYAESRPDLSLRSRRRLEAVLSDPCPGAA